MQVIQFRMSLSTQAFKYMSDLKRFYPGVIKQEFRVIIKLLFVQRVIAQYPICIGYSGYNLDVPVSSAFPGILPGTSTSNLAHI